MDISVILDDARPRDIVYYGTQWVQQANSNLAYNGTLTVCHTEIQNTTVPPSFTFYFYGSDINIYGPLTNAVALNYTIDSTSVRPGIINSNDVGKNNINIWNLQGLDNTVYHTLEVLPSGGLFSIDYLTYTPNKYTGLAGRSLILDDADHSIQYSANWTKTTGDFAVGRPYKGTMSGSSMKGSTMKFNFVGASISVYGLLNQKDGKLSASFSVDGGTAVTYTPFDGTQTVNASSWTLSQQFFHQDLVPGNHSLLVNLVEVTGSQTLWIDSLVFEGTSSTPLNQTSGGSGGTSPPSSSSGSALSNAAIGGIIAGAVVLAIILLCLRGKIQAMMSKPDRPIPANIVQPPPAPPMPQATPFLYPMNPSEAAIMNPGYANPSMIPPSMHYAPSSVSPPQTQEYHPTPLSYANTSLPPRGYPPSQFSFTDGSEPSPSHVSHAFTPQPMHPQQSSHAPQTPSQQSTILPHHQLAPAIGSSTYQANHTAKLDGDPVDDPPPYDEGV